MTTRKRPQKRRDSYTFAGIPHAVLKTRKYASLNAAAVKLLIDVTAQYTGYNNGDLQATWICMKDRGWRSKASLQRATWDLLEAGFIETTRPGGRNRCALFAITWQPIDECIDKRTKARKTDAAPTKTASGLWKDEPQREAA